MSEFSFDEMLFGATDDLSARSSSSSNCIELGSDEFVPALEFEAVGNVGSLDPHNDLAEHGLRHDDRMNARGNAGPVTFASSEEQRAQMPQFSGAVGCAILETAGGISGAGLASRNGGPSFRFKSVDEIHALHPDTLWITSAAPTTFSMQQGLRTQWLRDSCFFPTPLLNIMQEMGLPEGQDASSAQVVSEVMARSVRLARTLFNGMEFPGDAGSTLAENLHFYVTGGTQRGVEPRDILDALQSSFSMPLALDGQPKPNDIVLRLPLQRTQHLMTVLSGAVPVGAWREVNLRQIGDPFEWALEPGRAALAMVSVRTMGDAAGLMFKRGHGPRVRASWLAAPELKALHSLMNLDIKKMFVADELIPAAAALRCPPPALQPVDHGSISSGLMCEAFLAAACSSAPVRSAVARDSQGSTNVTQSSRAAWLNSAARAIALQEAVALSQERFNIIGYGIGHVMVCLPRTEISRLRSVLIRSSRLMHMARFL